MSYINFVVITSTPVVLRNFLINRGVLQEITDPVDGSTHLVGTRPGMEWVRVPNPILIDGVPDTRNVYLVKFAHQSVDNEVGVDSDTTQNIYDWSKFGRWVKNNSTVQNAPLNYTINGEWAGSAYKINGQQVWLVRDNPERFGTWQ